MKIKFAAFSIIMLATTVNGMAQKNKPEPAPAPQENHAFKHHRAILDQAFAYNDLAVATQATYDIICLGGEYAGYKDTLALIYFQRGAWPQVIAVTTEILKTKPEDPANLELRAISNQTIGRIKESLSDYELLYGSTKSPYHLYEIAGLQYALRRFGECDMTLGKLMQDPGIKELEILISTSESRQSVPMTAACRNMVGVLLMDQGKKDDAIKAFEDAISLFPNFELAKNNLKEAQKP